MARSAKGHQEELEDDEEEEFLTANTSTSLNKGFFFFFSLSLSVVCLCITPQGLSIDSLMGVSKFLSFCLYDSILQFNFQF